MSTGPSGTILKHINELVDATVTDILSDAELLERFATRHDEAAFAGLVRRHGRLVWGLCRRLLRHEQDAEDAFQATFLILARRATAIRKAAAVGSYLYGIAYRVALKAKKTAANRDARERQTAWRPESPIPSDLGWRELQVLLDEELQKLPEKLRAPFVFCCLESRARSDVARELGCGEDTLSSRIARARRLLQRRLAQRGVSLPAALTAGLLWNRGAGAVVPRAVVQAAVRAARRGGEDLSVGVRTLAEETMRSVAVTNWHIGAMLVLGCALLGLAGSAGSLLTGSTPPEAKPDKAAAPATEVHKDAHGDPLPAGALARLGTLQQRAPGAQLAITADGKEVVALGQEPTVRRFDALTGALRSEKHLPRTHPNQCWLSPRGTYALSGVWTLAKGYELELWHLAEGTMLRKLVIGKSGLIASAAFSVDEGCIAFAHSSSGESEHRILTWDLKAAEPHVVWSWRGDVNSRYFDPFVRFAPDGKRLLGCHLDRIVRCWDLAADKLLWESEQQTYTPFHFFSPDGRVVLSDLEQRDAATGKLIGTRLKPPDDTGTPIAYTPDSRFLVFQTDAEGIALWEPGAAKVALRLPGPPRRKAVGFIPNSLPADFAFTPDGQAVIRRSSTLQRWDLATSKAAYPDTEKWGHSEAVTGLVFAPDGKHLATIANDGTMRIWDPVAGQPLQILPRGCSQHLAVTPDGRHLLAAPEGPGKVALCKWDVASGRAVGAFAVADRNELIAASNDRELRFTRDGRLMLLTMKNGRSGDECILTTWEAATGKLLEHRRAPWGHESVLTPDGTSVIAADTAKGALRLLDAGTGETRFRFESDRQAKEQERCWENDLVLSPDGRTVAGRLHFFNYNSGTTELDALRVWEVRTGQQIVRLPVDGAAVLAFAPDGRVFGAATSDGIRLWETATWHEVGAIPAHNRGARSPHMPCATALALSPDGRVLATGHADSTILLWDATLRNGARGGALTPAEADALWTDLVSADAKRGYTALWRLADDPARSVLLFQERLKPVAPPAPEELRALLEGLESAQFNRREAAERALRKLGDRAGSALRTVLKANPPAETRRRLEAILADLEHDGPLTGEALSDARAVAALERIGSAEARQLLEGLAGGADSARLTRAAKDALGRLGMK